MRPAYKIVVVVGVLLITLFIAFLYVGDLVRFLPSLLQRTIQSVPGVVSLAANLTQKSVLSYSDASVPLFYSLLSYSTINATATNISVGVYAKDPVERIYLVNVTNSCVSCFAENALQTSLLASLQQLDLLANASSFDYIPLSDLALVASNSIVIIPSGLLPASLLNSANMSIFSLLARGDTIVYAGRDFSQFIGPTGQHFLTNSSVLAQLSAIGLQSGPLSTQAGTGSSASQGSQLAPANLSFRNPTFFFTYGALYYNVTYASAENGSIIAFSNYPTSSWALPQNMGSDIAKLISTRLWIKKIASLQSSLNTLAKPSGSIGLIAVPSSYYNTTSSFSNIANGTYTLLTIFASDPKSSVTKEISFANSYKAAGSLSLPSVVGETQIVPIVVQANNLSRSTLMHIEVYDQNMSYIGQIGVGFLTSENRQVVIHAFATTAGYYILELKDFNNNQYAVSLFSLAGADITPVFPLDFKNGTFVFSVYSNGLPVTNTTYSINLNGLYNSNGTISGVGGSIRYALPKGTIVNYGYQNFNIFMLDTSYTIPESYTQTIFYIPAIYIEFAIAIIVVVLLNLILKPPNRDEYYIDVPEFPPSRREQVRVQRSTVLGVFDQVNYYHRWKYMPLTMEEIKLGIGNNVKVNNMLISITSQSANAMLAKLVQGGDLASAAGYYAPKSWTEASKHSIEYLTIFRKLRDYCVTHAMLFTDLDSNNVADMVVSRAGKQLNAFIYDPENPTRKMILSRDSKIVLVFLNDDAVRDFRDELDDSFGKEAEVLKMGIEYNYLKLLDSDNLDQLVL